MESPSPEQHSDDENEQHFGNEEIPGQDNFIPYPPDQGQGQEPLDPKALKEAQKQEKKEQQRLEKERKEQEKREAKERKEQEKRDKQQLNSSAKEQRSTRQKPTRREVTTSAGHGIRCVVHLLDDTDYDANFDKSVTGQELFNKVCEHLNLIEKDYFSLTYYSKINIKTDERTKRALDVMFWLDHTKRIINQLQPTKGEYYEFDFVVKFYPPDPTQMKEDITRYQLCLQIRKDIQTRRLPGSFVTYALLGSYTAQAELGDYDESEHGGGYGYLQEIPFAPQGIQSDELLEKIAELHRSHRDQKPSEAELHFLDAAKKLSLYGVEKHPAKDVEGVDISVGVSAMGIMVYRDSDGVCMNHFAWPKVLKISYHHSKFYLRIRAAEMENAMTKVSFKLAHHKLAKRLWRSAIETHAFFRLKAPEVVKMSVMPHFGSKFRYSGRTYHQCRQDSGQISRGNPSFQRSISSRFGSNRSFQRGYGEPGVETPQYGQVQVLAGTGSDAHKVAYVKTVFHDERERAREMTTPPIIEEEELPPDQHDMLPEVPRHEPGADGEWTTTTTTMTTQEVTRTKKTKKTKEKKKKKKETEDQFNELGAAQADEINTNGRQFVGTDRVIPIVKTETRTTTYTSRNFVPDNDLGMLVSAHSVSSRNQAIDSVTYQTEQGETLVERRLHVSPSDDDDDVDYDRELSEAIKRVTRVDSNMEVKKIEVKTKTVH